MKFWLGFIAKLVPVVLDLIVTHVSEHNDVKSEETPISPDQQPASNLVISK